MYDEEKKKGGTFWKVKCMWLAPFMGKKNHLKMCLQDTLEFFYKCFKQWIPCLTL